VEDKSNSSGPLKNGYTCKKIDFAVLVIKKTKIYRAKVVKPTKKIAGHREATPVILISTVSKANRTKYDGDCKPINTPARVIFHPKCHWIGTGLSGIWPYSTLEL
jgi:hypothetical protein